MTRRPSALTSLLASGALAPLAAPAQAPAFRSADEHNRDDQPTVADAKDLNTPPVGTTQFVGCAIGGIGVGEAMRSNLPFYGALLATMLLVTHVPAFSPWLPGLLK